MAHDELRKPCYAEVRLRGSDLLSQIAECFENECSGQL